MSYTVARMNQTSLRVMLAAVLGIDEAYVVPKQGNWWNPQDLNRDPKPATWCAYLIESDRPVDLPYYQATLADDGVTPVNLAVQHRIGQVALQFVGPDAGDLASSVGLWMKRQDVRDQLEVFGGQLMGDSSDVTVNDFDQEGVNSVLAYNVRIRLVWPEVVDTGQGPMEPIDFQGGISFPAELTPAPSAGLFGYWPFDGPSVEDRSGLGNDFTYLSNLEFFPGVLPGGQQLFFRDANLTRMCKTAKFDFTGATGWTVSGLVAKVNPPPAGSPRIAEFGNYTDSEGFNIYSPSGVSNLSISFIRPVSLDETVTANGFFLATSVYHVAVTYTVAGRAWKIYRDGQLLSSGNLGNTPGMPLNTFALGNGASPSSSYQWVGTMDEVRLYNRALSAAEVAQLYRHDKGL